MKTDQRNNEITAIPELLSLLDMKGLTVTIDAIGCQKEILHQIVVKNMADYVIDLKLNHPLMHAKLSLYAQDSLATGDQDVAYQHLRTVEKGYGCIERRDYYLFKDLS